MRLDPNAKLFIGLKIDSKLREALAQATPAIAVTSTIPTRPTCASSR
jgi:hypothetical protein